MIISLVYRVVLCTASSDAILYSEEGCQRYCLVPPGRLTVRLPGAGGVFATECTRRHYTKINIQCITLSVFIVRNIPSSFLSNTIFLYCDLVVQME